MTDIPEEAVEAAAQALLDRVRQGMGRRPISLSEATGKDELLRRSEAALAAAAPIIRAEERKRIAEEIRATNLGAPLVLNSDGTARFLSGPELREEICTFITEGSAE